MLTNPEDIAEEMIMSGSRLFVNITVDDLNIDLLSYLTSSCHSGFVGASSPEESGHYC